MNMKIIIVMAVVAILVVASIAAVFILSQSGEKIVLKVFTAGSLSQPFSSLMASDGTEYDFMTIFEKAHPNVDVQVTSGGSADMIRKITDLNQTCDVLAVADATLIPSMMINATKKTADWVIQFSRNSMILAYTNSSHHANEINSTNWFNILRRPDVKFGFSSPNDDPAGYRSQMMMVLAQTYYNDSAIFRDLVVNNTNIGNATLTNGTYTIKVPTALTATNTSKVMIRSAEVDLTSALESGSIDYLFIYESVASSHASSGEKYLELPRQINLNDTSYAFLYGKVKVVQFYDNPNASKIKTVAGNPIVYGMTIPKNAVQIDLAIEFVKMVITDEGRNVMTLAGQENIVPALAGYWKSAVPAALRDLVG